MSDAPYVNFERLAAEHRRECRERREREAERNAQSRAANAPPPDIVTRAGGELVVRRVGPTGCDGQHIAPLWYPDSRRDAARDPRGSLVPPDPNDRAWIIAGRSPASRAINISTTHSTRLGPDGRDGT
jgi:hypothetical protein